MADPAERGEGSENRVPCAVRQRGATISCLPLFLLCSAVLCCAPTLQEAGAINNKDFVYLIQVQVLLVHARERQMRE